MYIKNDNHWLYIATEVVASELNEQIVELNKLN